MTILNNESKHSFATQSIHAGITPCPNTGALLTPIYQTTTYVQEGPIRCTHLLRQKPALILKFKFLQSTQHSNWTGRAFTAIPIPST